MPRQICWLLLTLCCLAPAQEITQVTMAKNGNIRYGPSLNAGVIVTLKRGTEVQILGKVDGKSGWYKIRFPEQGHAWIHSKVVQPTEQENVYRVVVDGARVRSDATIASDVVTDLPIGDEVIAKGHKVGDWLAVYPPSATAYVYQSVLNLSAPVQTVIAQREQAQATATTSIGRLWDEVRQIYAEYHAMYQKDRASASSLDWSGLLEPLKKVVDEHSSLRVRLEAQRLRTGIVRMLRASMAPVAPPRTTEPSQQPVASAPQPSAPQPSEPTAEPEAAPPVDTVPSVVDAPPEPPTDRAETEEVDDVQRSSIAELPGGMVVEGWLEERDIPGLGRRYAILGEAGVAAFIEVGADQARDLRSLFWRRVRVTGERSDTESDVPVEYQGVPTIQADDIRVVQ